ncbi:lysophospholipid acyltransferase family protein [Sporichthya brevicatena]|uniref:Lysophospholipid acyltransferase family protein n=1 Tax=Sporichthya brevicatena TaxID=171442 RepID=A0ABN1H841_9ACTN
MPRDRKRPWFRAAEATLLPPLLLLVRRRWSGQEHIPRTGGAILVANHISKIDPITFGHFVHGAGRVPHFLAKVELFRHPLLGRVLRGTDMIPVYRGGQSANASVDAAVRAVQDGFCIVVYAEATITRDPDLWPMVGKTGAARIALKSGAPLIPVAQWGPHRILPPYSRRLSLLPRKTVHVRAGAPIQLDDLADREPTPEVLAEATERVMAAITAELETIRGERAPKERFDPRKAGVAEYGNPHTDPRA